jgi:hypothetical protein
VQLPRGAHTFAELSVGEVRQMHGVPDGQSESVEHSSYEQPPGPTMPSNGKQRPLVPLRHCESNEQATLSEPVAATPGPYGWVSGPGARCEEQHGEARWFRGTPAVAAGGDPASATVDSQDALEMGPGAPSPIEPPPAPKPPVPPLTCLPQPKLETTASADNAKAKWIFIGRG